MRSSRRPQANGQIRAFGCGFTPQEASILHLASPRLNHPANDEPRIPLFALLTPPLRRSSPCSRPPSSPHSSPSPPPYTPPPFHPTGASRTRNERAKNKGSSLDPSRAQSSSPKTLSIVAGKLLEVCPRSPRPDFRGSPAVVADFAERLQNLRPILVALADRHPAFCFASTSPEALEVELHHPLAELANPVRRCATPYLIMFEQSK